MYDFLKVFLLAAWVLFPVTVLADHPGPPPNQFSSPCAIHYPSDHAIPWSCQTLKKGETIERMFGERWIDIARFNRIDRRHAFPGMRLKVPLRLEQIDHFTPMPAFFPAARQQPKLILISLSEQFLGAYEFGHLKFSSPVSSGRRGIDFQTPLGWFRATAVDRQHESSVYPIEESDIPYPMHYGIRFYISRSGISYWIHGRDVPGYAASHGCVGLYDEAMQSEYYGSPRDPRLADAKQLYDWVIGERPDSGHYQEIEGGPKVFITRQSF